MDTPSFLQIIAPSFHSIKHLVPLGEHLISYCIVRPLSSQVGCKRSWCYFIQMFFPQFLLWRFAPSLFIVEDVSLTNKIFKKHNSRLNACSFIFDSHQLTWEHFPSLSIVPSHLWKHARRGWRSDWNLPSYMGLSSYLYHILTAPHCNWPATSHFRESGEEKRTKSNCR